MSQLHTADSADVFGSAWATIVALAAARGCEDSWKLWTAAVGDAARAAIEFAADLEGVGHRRLAEAVLNSANHLDECASDYDLDLLADGVVAAVRLVEHEARLLAEVRR